MSLDPKFVAPTLVEALARLGHEDRGFVFVHADGSEHAWSFANLCREARRRAARLHAAGLRRGDRIALVVPDPEDFVLSFLGAVLGGFVPVPVSPQLSFKNVASYHDTVAHIAGASGATLLVTSEATRSFVEPVLPRVTTLREIVTTEALNARDHGELAVDVAPDDLAFLQFTSGSTSRPKGVMVTHRNLAWNSESFMIHGLRKDSSFDKGVSWLPLFHDMGLIGFVIGPIFTDVPVVFIPTASFVRNPRIWLDKIHAHRGTITYAPNFAYALVAKRLKDKDVSDLDLSCLRRVGCGAEPIQANALRDFAERLAPAKFNSRAFLASYGMAEATLAITFAPADEGLHTDRVAKRSLEDGAALPASDPEELLGATTVVDCGRVFPHHDIAIIDREGNVLADRCVGEIVARGPSLAAGYFNEPELTAETFRKDAETGEVWLRTGDLGYTAHGSLFVCGRLKDMIIVRGRNVYPNDIEWAVGEIPGVRRGNVAAFGVFVDGEEHLVVAAEGHSDQVDVLQGDIAQAVQAAFSLVVREVVVVAQGGLPRTSSGKPQRRKTREMYQDGTLARARTVQGVGAQRERTGAGA